MWHILGGKISLFFNVFQHWIDKNIEWNIEIILWTILIQAKAHSKQLKIFLQNSSVLFSKKEDIIKVYV